MKPGQTRVTVLLIILLVLELVIQPGVKSWVTSVQTSINSAFSSSASGQNPPIIQALGGVDPNASSGVKVTRNGKTTTLTNAQWRAIAGQNGV